MNTTYFINLVVNNLFLTDTDPALPEAYWIGLSTSAPNVAGTGALEPSAEMGYNRVKMEGLSAASNGVITNSAAISWPESTGYWGELTHYVVFDAQVGGNLLFYGALEEARTVEAATVVTMRSNTLTISLSNG